MSSKLNFKNLPVLILGLGVHGGGAAVAKWLLSQGAKLTISDLKSRGELKASLASLGHRRYHLILGQHPLRLLKNCRLIVQNPAVPNNIPLLRQARRRGIAIENEASLFLKLCRSNLIIAITGSKGKSTTASLLGKMVERWRPQVVVAGNIRQTVMFAVLDKIGPVTPVILELSSWQLEQVGKHHLRVPLAVITNVLPDHLNRYSSYRAYAQAKAQIFRWQKAGDAVILNYDNETCRQLAPARRARTYWFSLHSAVRGGAFVRAGHIYIKDKKTIKLLAVSRLKLMGEHNLANVLAASLAAYLTGVPIGLIREAAAAFTGLPDRLELIRRWRGIKFYNDTTATAPAATLAALKSLARESIVLLAGGVDKNLPYDELARYIRANRRVKLVLLPGTATDKLYLKLKEHPYWLVKSLAAAVRQAVRLAKAGDVVLLSPAAASFNLFKHEFDRGQQFIRLVKKLKA